MSTTVNRNNLFYSEDDFQFECDLMEGYLEEDTNQTVVVYEVDRVKTNINSIYKETDAKNNIRFKTPKEVPCLYEISDPKVSAYDNATNNATYAINGNLTCYILNKSFKKYKCDIKRGDYLGILVDNDRMAYFVVTDDGKVNTSNRSVVGAYKAGMRVIKAAPLSTGEFTGK